MKETEMSELGKTNRKMEKRKSERKGLRYSINQMQREKGWGRKEENYIVLSACKSAMPSVYDPGNLL